MRVRTGRFEQLRLREPGHRVCPTLDPPRPATPGNTLVSSGESGPPCGVPSYRSLTTPPSLLGGAFHAVLVHRLAICDPRFLPTLGRPHAVALHFIRRDQLMAGLAPAGVRPCWAHNDKAAWRRRHAALLRLPAGHDERAPLPGRGAPRAITSAARRRASRSPRKPAQADSTPQPSTSTMTRSGSAATPPPCRPTSPPS